MRYFLLTALAFTVGCSGHGCSPEKRAIDDQPALETRKPEDPGERIEALEKRLADATARGDEIARLSVLKDIVAERLRQAEASVSALKTEKDSADKALGEARIEASRTKLWWFVGIMSVASAALVALAIFVPSVAKWSVRGAAACGAVAALAAFVSWLLPYLFWVGLALLIVGLVSAIVYWRLDAKSRDQVVKAVDDLKERIPDYRDHFNKYIDEDADLHLDRARERLGIKSKDI
jgi:hypothetical protein